MESSRRAVESYWRSRMIDGVTTDEDKVAPVYKLEEVCELLRSSPVGIVKEVLEFILKRVDHKSPIVKQKALRLIKYAVVKSGAEFRREMQRHSVVVRQLIHYKGQPDPLKGDALNKAVRETAQEALSAIYSADDNKTAVYENLGSRIQGFGNTNFEMSLEDRKSFISEVVDLGSATIKQGLSNFMQAQSLEKNDTGNYKSPNLRRSLTTENKYSDRYEGVGSRPETEHTSQLSANASGTWSDGISSTHRETNNEKTGSNNVEKKTHEERLLETIVTSGGVRLQPTRDALQVFLVEAAKVNKLALSRTLEVKLQSHVWQVRMKAMCVVEAILRKKNDGQFSTISSYFSDRKDVIVKCSESPQASLREKSMKVLSLLDGETGGSIVGHKPMKAEMTTVQMPDLIDTGDSVDLCETEVADQNSANFASLTKPVIDDLFGDTSGASDSTNEQKNNEDPFMDVSFHVDDDKEQVANLFSGMTFDEPGAAEVPVSENKNGPVLLDIFGSISDHPQEHVKSKNDFNDLVVGLSLNTNESSVNQKGTFLGTPLENISDFSMNPSHLGSSNVFNGVHRSQAVGMNANPMFQLGQMPYNFPAGLMVNPTFTSQPINYGAMGSLLAQQQFLATMSNFQQLGNLQSQNVGVSHAAGSSNPLPDIFNPSIPPQAPNSMMNSSKKEDSSAFNFISDHLAAARDTKRVM